MNRGVVKIIASNIDTDWYSPYKTKDNNESIGTGFFINNKGYIVTCAHVVESSIKTFFTVPAHSRDQKEAVLVSICHDKDIALLRAVDYQNTDFLELADSDQVKQGEEVSAVGYPLGQDRLKLTSGIISGRQGRYFQTDAPINGGNSGGPLLNTEGKVVGINTAKMASFMADNIGYATPINDFKVIQDIMFASDKNNPTIVRKPMLVCQFNNTDKYLMQYLKTPTDCRTGYYVKHIYDCSPLYKVGVREGDVLCQFDGLDIDNFGESSVEWSSDKVHIYDLLDRYKVGDKVKIEYWSLQQLLETGEQTVQQREITLIETDPYLKIRMLRPPIEEMDFEIIGGMIIAPLTLNHIKTMYDQDINEINRYNLKSYLKLEKRFDPVLIVANIFPGSYVRTTDTIQPGDIIDEVNDIAVNELEQFREAFCNCQDVGGKRFVKMKLKNRTTVVLSLEKIIEEEHFLSEKYKYKLSPMYLKLEGESKSSSSVKPGTKTKTKIQLNPDADSPVAMMERLLAEPAPLIDNTEPMITVIEQPMPETALMKKPKASPMIVAALPIETDESPRYRFQ